MDKDEQLLVIYFGYAQYPLLEYCIEKYLKNNYNVLTGDVILDSIELCDIDVTAVFAKEIENNFFQFRVIATACIINSKRVDGMDYNRSLDYVTIELIFSGRLIDKELKVECLNVMKYSNDKEEQGKQKTYYSISYIPQCSLDNEAEKFLNKYCPEALMTPGAIEIDKLLKRMRLQLYYAPLEKNVLGKILFYDDVQEVFKDQRTPSKVTEYKSLPSGTILLAPKDSDSHNNLCSRLFTIVHECVHWEKHKNHFKLMSYISDYMDCFFNALENADLQLCHNDFSLEQIELLREKQKELIYYQKVDYWKSYSCDGELKKGGYSTYNAMEWQANNLAARILMPEKTTRRKLYEILSDLKNQYPNSRNGILMMKAIKKLADFYQVSLMTAKYRAIQLGFEQAVGVLNYVDGQLVEPIWFKDGALSKYQTFVVDRPIAEKEMAEKEELNFLVQSGGVVYLNGMFIFNHPRYVEVDAQGDLKPTEYALEHADECCFVLSVQPTWNQADGEDRYVSYFLNRPANSAKNSKGSILLDDPSNSYLVQKIREPEKIRKEIDGMIELLEQGLSGVFPDKAEDKKFWMIEGFLPTTLHQKLQWHISRLSMKKENGIDDLLDVATNCSLDSTSVENHLKQKNAPLLPTVMAYCIGLHLEPFFALDLMDKAGFSVLTPTFENAVYLYLIFCCRDESIDTCNWIIQELNKLDPTRGKRQVRYIPNDKKGKPQEETDKV